MTVRVLLLSTVLLVSVSSPAAAQAPEPAALVAELIAAYGGEQVVELGILQLDVSETETTNDGEQHQRSYAIFVDASNLGRARMGFPGDVDIACGDGGCWATVNGVLDSRPQAPLMARKTLNQSLFPLLLPFSLQMNGVQVGGTVSETSWNGRAAWVLSVGFSPGFFAAPIMQTTWEVVVARDDHSLLAAHFVPPVELQKVEPEGIRYRVLKTTTVEDVRLPTQILLDGIDPEGVENGHVNVMKIDVAVYGPSEPTLFMSPK